ncbi:MAG: polysaccharide pyruvyl transferase family protein [Agriterribacter sp.]
MRYINLKWAKSEDDNQFNFGDDLSPYIINKLSGLEVRYFHFANSRINGIKQFVHGILHGRFSLKYVSEFLKCFFAKNYLVSIGSILQWYSSERCIVWGSGIINQTDHISKSNFLAVRGEYTKARIKELGYNAPEIIGDPALLTPLVYTPAVKKKYKLGIIPHITHYDIIKSKISSPDIKVIKLDNHSVEKIIDDIVSCEYTISTSLHGIIVSHAYNIKSLWFSYNTKPIPGNNVKFLDYFSSVKIPAYAPFPLSLGRTVDVREIEDLMIQHDDISHAHIDIRDIQRGLIKVAPFPVLEQFKTDGRAISQTIVKTA